MRQDHEVTEFVIMSGPDVHDYLVAIRAQLRAYLAAAFPEFSFSLVSREGEGMGFLVVPVVGTVGGEHSAIVEPNYATIFEIKSALEAFKPLGASVH